jgi:hypothetical protein
LSFITQTMPQTSPLLRLEPEELSPAPLTGAARVNMEKRAELRQETGPEKDCSDEYLGFPARKLKYRAELGIIFTVKSHKSGLLSQPGQIFG